LRNRNANLSIGVVASTHYQNILKVTASKSREDACSHVPYMVHCVGGHENQIPEHRADAFGKQEKRVPVFFFRTVAGGEPVRDWLKNLLLSADRKRIGEDLKTVEFGWPVGMPVCKPLGDGIDEVRSNLAQNRTVRVLFYIDKKVRMVLLHGFIKKTRKTPHEDLEFARSNKSKHQRGLQ
jgi:phage-related protein